MQLGTIGYLLWLLRKTVCSLWLPASLVFSVDETGLTAVQRKQPKIFGLKGKRLVGALTVAERGSLVKKYSMH
jgi:hypothetical protein